MSAASCGCSPIRTNWWRLSVPRFTDDTFEQLKTAGTPGGGGVGGSIADLQASLRNHLHWNFDTRILADVLSDAPGGLFVAFISGNRYSKREIFQVDPQGAVSFFPAGYGIRGFIPNSIAPEEVAFVTWDDNKYGTWFASHLKKEVEKGVASGTQESRPIDIVRHRLDVGIEKSGYLNGDAVIEFRACTPTLRVAPLNLFYKLRVKGVWTASGESLDFIQEDDKSAWGLYVVLPKPVAAGETFAIRVKYGGKDAVSNEGGGNYYPVSRDDWYPNTAFSDYAQYEMRFSIPRKMKMVATGKRLKEADEGDQNVSEWKTEVPQAVAGFSMGRFKAESATVRQYGVASYANEEAPDWVRSVQQIVEGTDQPRRMGSGTVPFAALGTMSTTTMLKKTLAEAQASLDLFEDYFGPASYKEIAVTQQTACNYGQAWPGLVYLPICSFFDTTVRQQLGMQLGDRGYWIAVGPHEIAHQWWGHTVGFNSYRDQWMSEGFANLAASIFIQRYYGHEKFKKFWEDQRYFLTSKNRFGWRPIDAGPVTLGYRLFTHESEDVAQKLIYPKGAYILHMIRMMMYDPKQQDERFKKIMRDFVETYRDRPASTEDFKALVEKHMTPAMDLDGNKKMDWFFNQWVYGTGMPGYQFEHAFSPSAEGMKFRFKLAQTGVGEGFKMTVPVYLELSDGRVIRLGIVLVNGTKPVEQELMLPLKETPRRAMINYMDDVLAAD